MKAWIGLAVLLPTLAASQPFVGDTIGGTTYDRQFNGPSRRTVCFDPNLGVHAIWMYSASTGNSFPDRNVRYNFFDLATTEWCFNQGSSFMDFGVSVFPARSGFGTLDVHPVTGCAYVAAHADTAGRRAIAARDAAPGSGIFSHCVGPSEQLWPGIGLSPDRRVHIVTLDADGDTAFYSAIEPWGTWSQPVPVSENHPLWANACLEVSVPGNRVAIAWVRSVELPYQCYYRVSTNSGRNWEPEVELAAPPAFTPGSDTTPSFAWCGHGLLWDNQENLHVVVALMPMVEGIAYVLPAEIWHYSPVNYPVWNRITRATCEDPLRIRGSVGYNAIYACRPILGIDEFGALYCAWEQYDSMNPEPSTGVLRADIFIARSVDNGTTWGSPVKLTATDNTSHRFPSLVRVVLDRKVRVVYLQDLIAGEYIYGSGACSNNPVVCVTGPVWSMPVTEAAAESRADPVLTAAPNPFRQALTLDVDLPVAGSAWLTIRDAAGRIVDRQTIRRPCAGRERVVWRAGPVPAGVYFCTASAGGRQVTRRVTRVP